jgi:hypothetical protein
VNRPVLPITRAGRIGLAMRTGVLLVLLAAFLPLQGCKEHPSHFVTPRWGSAIGYGPESEEEYQFTRDFPDLVRQRWLAGKWTSIPADSDEYGAFLLLPVFAAGIWGLRLRGGRRFGLLAARAGFAGFLLVYGCALADDVRTGFPGLRLPTAVVAWLAGGAFVWFGPRRWGRGDPRPLVGSLAMACLLYALHFPVREAMGWGSRHSVGDTAAALWANYLPGYRILVAGLALIALPAWLPRRRRGDRAAGTPTLRG